MLKKTSILNKRSFIEGNVNLPIKVKNNYHESHLLKSKMVTKYDNFTFGDSIGAVINTEADIKKSQEIHQTIKCAENQAALKILKSVKKTFKMALKHYCVSDVINETDKTVTVIFLPITTSHTTLSCGIQKFEKIHTYSNEFKDFYITRLLFQKTMTRSNYNAWLNSTGYNFKGDVKARQIIFDCIQKDLDLNEYSILKDSDIMEPNPEFFSKELPLIKYKFTDLEI